MRARNGPVAGKIANPARQRYNALRGQGRQTKASVRARAAKSHVKEPRSKHAAECNQSKCFKSGTERRKERSGGRREEWAEERSEDLGRRAGQDREEKSAAKSWQKSREKRKEKSGAKAGQRAEESRAKRKKSGEQSGAKSRSVARSAVRFTGTAPAKKQAFVIACHKYMLSKRALCNFVGGENPFKGREILPSLGMCFCMFSRQAELKRAKFKPAPSHIPMRRHPRPHHVQPRGATGLRTAPI